MIVKNESHIIEETLEMLSEYIVYWVICDTGSTDNTIEIIKNFFDKKNIPGELYEDKWEDFGRNRTNALKRAYNKADYIFVFDADDIIVGDLIFPEIMNKDGYMINIGKDFSYKRNQIFKADLEWVYKGVLHEYPTCLSKSNTELGNIDGDYYIDSRRLGDRSKDPNKYLNDAQILIKGLEKDPDLKSRYLFYIAQSYKDYGDLEESIKWYSKRVKEGGWIEETYYSQLQVAILSEKINLSEDIIINEFIKAFAIINNRREALFYLALYLKKIANKELHKKNQLLNKALIYIEQVLKIPYNPKYILFVHKDIFEWKAEFEYANILFELDRKSECIKICKELLNKNEIRIDKYIYNIIEKLKNKCINYNENDLIKYPKEIINRIYNKVKNNNNLINITCTITTCKRLNLFIKTINSFLNCCRDIDLIDRWICIDDNSSDEDRDFMQNEYPFIEFIFKSSNEKGHSKSMNIIQKMINSTYILHLEDDWLFIEKTYMIKPALFILENDNYKIIDSRANLKSENKIMQVLFNKNYSEDIDSVIHGGYLMETSTIPKIKFLLHEHTLLDKTDELNNYLNCAYWPHYSFRPSIFKREIFDNLGNYDLNGFFERTFADKYYNYGYLSCFYDKILCIHIGKKTKDTIGVNAYSLNNEDQFGNIKNDNYINEKQNIKV